MSIDSVAQFPSGTGIIRVLAIIPGNGSPNYFMMAKRQVTALRELGIDVRSFVVSSRSSLRSIVKQWIDLRRVIVQFRPHVLHAHFGTVTGFLSAVAGRTPLIITFRGSDLQTDSDANPLRSLLGRILSQVSCLRAAKSICVSKQLRDRLWWHRDRAAVIPTGTDLDMFCPRPKDEARKLLGWNMQERVVLFNGKDRPCTKGLDLVQTAIPIAEKIVGPIRLEFLETDFEQVPLYLNAADCLAMASVAEGSPNIVKEALACNLPIVSVDVGDVAERLSEVRPSKIVGRDPNAFGAALAEILRNPTASNGRLCGKLCSEIDTAKAIALIYESVARVQQIAILANSA